MPLVALMFQHRGYFYAVLKDKSHYKTRMLFSYAKEYLHNLMLTFDSLANKYMLSHF